MTSIFALGKFWAYLFILSKSSNRIWVMPGNQEKYYFCIYAIMGHKSVYLSNAGPVYINLNVISKHKIDGISQT